MFQSESAAEQAEGRDWATFVCTLHRTGDGLIFTGPSKMDFSFTAGLFQLLVAPRVILMICNTF